MAIKVKSCEHMDAFNYQQRKIAKAYVCEECVATGDEWIHLRTCQSCGITLCCDSSPNQHATKHAKSHQHAIATSAEPGEHWAWCYTDEIFKKFES